MNRGLERVRMVPHHDARLRSRGFTDCENMLKQTSRRNGWMGSCNAGNIEEPQRSCSVPWNRDWRNMSKERRRKAGLDSVDSVNGRNRRTCKKLDRLGTRM